MKKELIYEICRIMSPYLSSEQNIRLEKTLNQVLTNFSIPDFSSDMTVNEKENNTSLINQFLSAKKIAGCSENTLKYYCNTLTNLMSAVQKISVKLLQMIFASISRIIRALITPAK